MGRRPIWEVKGIFFLLFADQKFEFEPLCTLYSDWPKGSVLLYSSQQAPMMLMMFDGVPLMC